MEAAGVRGTRSFKVPGLICRLDLSSGESFIPQTTKGIEPCGSNSISRVWPRRNRAENFVFTYCDCGGVAGKEEWQRKERMFRNYGIYRLIQGWVSAIFEMFPRVW